MPVVCVSTAYLLESYIESTDKWKNYLWKEKEITLFICGLSVVVPTEIIISLFQIIRSPPAVNMLRPRKMPPFFKLTLVVLCAYILWTFNHPDPGYERGMVSALSKMTQILMPEQLGGLPAKHATTRLRRRQRRPTTTGSTTSSGSTRATTGINFVIFVACVLNYFNSDIYVPRLLSRSLIECCLLENA